MYHSRISLHAFLAGTALLSGSLSPAILQAETIVGLSTDNMLVRFDTANPGVTSLSQPVSGLAADEQLVGIDYRPATGQLYGLGRSSRLYTIDLATASASMVGASSFNPILVGDAFGFDFNPTVDRIRVVSDSGQNLRLHPVTGAVAATDKTLTYASMDAGAGQLPQVVGSAYTENRAGALSTTLYGIDSVMDTLVRQAPPNDGVLTTVGGLGVNFTDMAGFDISGVTGAAYASLVKAGDSWSGLYSINLTSGQASWLGNIGSGQSLADITVVPEPSSLSLLALIASGLLLARRKRSGQSCASVRTNLL